MLKINSNCKKIRLLLRQNKYISVLLKKILERFAINSQSLIIILNFLMWKIFTFITFSQMFDCGKTKMFKNTETMYSNFEIKTTLSILLNIIFIFTKGNLFSYQIHQKLPSLFTH